MLAGGVPNSLLDLNKFDEETLARDGCEGSSEDVRRSKSNANNANLIRRFNQHSTMVLQAADNLKSSTPTPTTTSVSAGASASTSSSAANSPLAATSASTSTDESVAKKQKLLVDKTEFEDLEADRESVGVAMNLGRLLSDGRTDGKL